MYYFYVYDFETHLESKKINVIILFLGLYVCKIQV